jgi:hypothetical protein
MSNLLLILDAEGVSSSPRNGDDRVGPDFPPSWEEFVVARRRFFDLLAHSSPSPLSDSSERSEPPDLPA